MFPRAAKAIGRSDPSVPPTRATSTSPWLIIRIPSMNAITLLAQAATWVITGPVMPNFMETWQAAMDPDRAGMANGETCPGPFSAMTCVPMMTWSIPPPPVLRQTAARSRWSGSIALKSRPASFTASVEAAMARWMNRLMRRAIFRSIAVAGSKSLTSAAIRTSRPDESNCVIGPTPLTPAMRFCQ